MGFGVADGPPASVRERERREYADRSWRSAAPLRLSLAGGGSDLAGYSDTFGGAVINVTIGRYAYAHLRLLENPVVVMEACDAGIVETSDLGSEPPNTQLPLHWGVYRRVLHDFNDGVPFGTHIRTFVDAPLGSGLGASSALTVAIVEVFRAALELPLGRYDIAHLAYAIERFDLGLPGGKQDQYASAFGGVNFIEFLPGDRVVVNPLRLNNAVLLDLQSSMVVCFSGQARKSQEVINEQVSALAEKHPDAIQKFHQLKDDAFAMKMALLRGDLREAGTILDRSWLAKKGTAANVSNPLIEHLLEVAHKHGAFAGKISGAGGGGFIVFFADPESKPTLMRSLDEAGGKSDSIVLSTGGVEAWRTSI